MFKSVYISTHTQVPMLLIIMEASYLSCESQGGPWRLFKVGVVIVTWQYEWTWSGEGPLRWCGLTPLCYKWENGGPGSGGVRSWHSQSHIGSKLQTKVKNQVSGSPGQVPLPQSPLCLASLEEIIASSQQRVSAWWGFVTSGASQAGWGDNDYVGRLVIRQESLSPLNTGCFIWSQKTGLASIVCTELVDKRPAPKGNISLRRAKAPHSRCSLRSGIWDFWAASGSLCLSLQSAKVWMGWGSK